MTRKRNEKTKEEKTVDGNRQRIELAKRSLFRSILGPLLEHVYVIESRSRDDGLRSPMLMWIWA